MSEAGHQPSSPATSPPALLELADALTAMLADVSPLDETETVELGDALDRVLAEPLIATVDVPGFDNSAMDGYAIRHDDLRGRSPHLLKITQQVLAGDTPRPLSNGEAARIFTGAPLPEGADTVVVQEECDRQGGSVRIDGRIGRGDHVRRRAHDFARGDVLLAAGHRVRLQDLAIAAATGATGLRVSRRPRLALFSTGNELALPGRSLPPYHRYTANNHLLAGLAAAAGCEVTDAGVIADDIDATREKLVELAGGHDVVLSSGGASVGDADHVRRALDAVGEINFWRIAVRPGKPVLFGRVGKTAFAGLPGNPVSCFVTFLLLVKPLVLALQGAARTAPARYAVQAAFDWPTAGTRREFVRARLEDGAKGPLAVSIYPNQSSDVLSSVVWADGLVEIPPGTVIRRGDTVAYLPFSGLLDG